MKYIYVYGNDKIKYLDIIIIKNKFMNYNKIVKKLPKTFNFINIEIICCQ